jgi:MFS transporter, DHA1 family, multidrug resistance protein
MPKTFMPLLILSLITCCIEIDISVPGFPDMAKFFNVSEGAIQLTIAYNFLGFCLAGLFYGPLSDCYGRRKMMILGNGLLLIGAVGCAFAPSLFILFVSRFIQGLGASASAVVVFAMIADAYTGEKAIKLIGIMNSALTVLMAIAPIIGSFINQAVGWRGNYAIVATMSLISWLLLVFLLPETKKEFEPFHVNKVLNNYKTLFCNAKFLKSSLIPSLQCSAYFSFVACGVFLYTETFNSHSASP